MKLLLYLSLLLLTLFNLYLSSSSVRHNEVNFFNDVARDFLLLQELDQKKIVFIGPRSSTNGLFHGSLWTYINYPAYLLGNGNPVAVGWFWVFLEAIFLITGFFIAQKLFGSLVAFVYIALTSTRIVLHINGVFHTEAIFFFMPMFFFTICMYAKSKKKFYLVLHTLSIAILIQLNVGIGMQFFILSALFVCWFIVRQRPYKHFLAFFLLPIFLINFILFDLKHGLGMTKAVFSTGVSSKFFVSIQSWIENRINNTVSLQLDEQNIGNTLLTYIIFALVIIFTILQIKNRNKYQQIYFLFIFYYFGYIVLSVFNKGILLFHYVYLLIPLTTLWFASFLATKYRLFFLPLIAIVFFNNFNNDRGQVSAQSYGGNTVNSWKGLSNVASEVISWQKGKEFGYFVFAPDALAYQPRYAMLYNFKKAGVRAFEYAKKSTTYIIAAPPHGNDPYMTHVWWRKVPLRISSEPIETKKFPSGFTIEKFQLSEEEQRVPHDKAIELRIHFR